MAAVHYTVVGRPNGVSWGQVVEVLGFTLGGVFVRNSCKRQLLCVESWYGEGSGGIGLSRELVCTEVVCNRGGLYRGGL